MDLSKLYGPGYAGYLHGQEQVDARNARGLQGLGMLSDMQTQAARQQMLQQRFAQEQEDRRIAMEQAQRADAQIRGLLSRPADSVRGILGMDPSQAGALYGIGGSGLLGKVLQENMKSPDALKMVNALGDPAQREAALRSKTGIAPTFHTMDRGGVQTGFTFDPVSQQAGQVFSAPKTAAPASVPFELSGMDPSQARDYLLSRSRAGATQVNVDARERQRTFENENKIRDDFKTDPRVKAADEMQTAFKMIETAYMRPSPANDLAMATKYMKILDPTSVVRESELAMSLAATGLLDKVRSYAENVITGKKLNPTQRKDFYESARAINSAFQKQVGKVADEYRGIARQYDLNPANVTPGRKEGPVMETGKTPSIDELLKKY